MPRVLPRQRIKPRRQTIIRASLAVSLDQRIRAALAGMSLESTPEAVQQALETAGLSLRLETVRAWLDRLVASHAEQQEETHR